MLYSTCSRYREGNINFDQVVIDENDEIDSALKKIVETINNLVHEMNLLTASAMEGQLNIRGNEEAFTALTGKSFKE